MPRDLVSLRQEHAKAVTAAETALAANDQTAFDAAVKEAKEIDKEIDNVETLNKLKGDTAKGTPGSENPDDGNEAKIIQPFVNKYRHLPASAHVLEEGKALTAAQGAALGDLLLAVRRQKLTGRADPMLIEASLGANETVAVSGTIADKIVSLIMEPLKN